MRTIRRLATVAIMLVIALLLAGAGVVGGITAGALPQVSGTLRIPGLERPVTIVRDKAGIAQITAETPHDLFLAQGFVHAQDRLWQMEVWRRIGAGRLSELFGRSQLETDRFIRTVGWRQAAERDLELLSPAAREALQAYADGVNAFLSVQDGAPGLSFVVAGLLSGQAGGLEGYRPEPWTPLDSATWQKTQAFNLSANYGVELFRMLADAQLGDPALTDSLVQPYRSDKPVITPSGLPGSGGAGAALVGAASDPDGTTGTRGTTPGVRDTAPVTWSGAQAAAWREVARLGSAVLETAGLDRGGPAGERGIGSNSWVVAPSLSATGQAILANDPHLGLGMPSVWYVNGLHCRVVSAACPYDVTGVSFPGTPFVVLGHNGRIAWGATNAGPDVQDLFIETVDPADPSRYLDRGRSVPFETRTETIRVAGEEPVTITVRSTRHGPIINDIHEELRDHPRPLALQWTALAVADRTFDAFLALNQAANYAEFRAALADFGGPSQNFVYADSEGHIGYQLPGLIPIRPAGDDGRRPVDGASGAHDWLGYIAYDELPRQLDPAPGLIVTANNAMVDDRYPYLIGGEADPGDRAGRIHELLQAAGADGLTTDELRAIQMDTFVPRAGDVIGRLGDARPGTANGAEVLALLHGWDGRCDVESRGCAAYMTFELELERAIFDDQLGPLAADFVGSALSWPTLVALLDDPAAAWWDDVRTAGRETQRMVIDTALDSAGQALAATLGASSRWMWGRIHQVTLAEATLGESGIGPLAWYFNAPPVAVAGAAGAVNNQYWRADRAYEGRGAEPDGLRAVFAVTNGPSYRLVVDLGDLDGARIVQTTGQSGNPFDRHYGDLVRHWTSGQSVPLPFSPEAVARSAASTLVLEP